MRTKIVVISLPDATQRRAAFSARARDAAVTWSYFDARRKLGPDLTYDADEAVVAKARPLGPGELGCYASHYAAWLEFLASDSDQLIVLEDDTIVDWAFLATLAETDLAASGIGYLRLFAKRPSPFRRVSGRTIEARRYLIEFLDYAYGTQAYALTRGGAERFVRHCRVVRRPIDDELDRSWDHGIPCLSVFPFPVIEEASSSSIGRARFEPFEIPARLRGRRYRSKMAERALRFRQRLRMLKEVGRFAAASLVGP